MGRIDTRIAAVAETLDAIERQTTETNDHIETNRAANAVLAQSSEGLRSGSARIGSALNQMQEEATRIQAAQARLVFENARLKRSSRGMRDSLARLQQAEDTLRQRALEAQNVAAFAERTAALINEIDSRMSRGEPVEGLLDAGRLLAQASPPRTTR